MDATLIPPISGHSLLVLLLQLAGILLLARTLAEVMRRLGQPAILGELLAGILLGPTVLGHWAPDLFRLAFPPDVAQFHLLEVFSWLGMILLLLLTGLETDLRIVRTIGRAAVLTSVGGLLVNFTAGATLGFLLPSRFLVSEATRPIFAAFLATALAITAMPVIAKILIDLGLIRRNLGVTILSAGVIDDTTGWLVLSVIAGIASAGVFSAQSLALSLGGLTVFLLVMRYVTYPVFARLVAYVNERVQLAGADVTLVLVFTFLAAAATEAIGVHAVFGAFVTGLMVRQVPRIRANAVHALETFVLSALSPVFFAFVGLKVDLWALTGWQLPTLVIGVAMLGKLLGCYTGARVGGLSHWEGVAIGFGMNARGAMELIVALIGLSLGLLTAEMYSTIVLVAVVTSFLAPLLLRAVIGKVPLTEEERRRIEDESRPRFVPAGNVRVLIPTAGGGNAMSAFAIAAPVVQARQGTITALYVERQRSGNAVLRWLFGGGASLAGRGLDEHLERAAALLGDQRKRLSVRRVVSDEPAAAVLREAERDYDLIMMGAAAHHLIAHSVISDVMAGSRVPTVIVRASNGAAPEPLRRVLVPVDGSLFSRYAAEFAFTFADAAGARVTLLHVLNEARVGSGALAVPDSREAHDIAAGDQSALEERIRTDYGALASDHHTPWDVRVLASGDPSGTIIDESHSEHYDLLVLGAENKMLAQPLFFGQGTAAIVERAGCTTAVVVPRME